jgi:dipeptidyl-peptidase 9
MFNGTNRKRSWSELLAAVKATRSLCLSGRQSTRTPNNFTFSDTKLYFLALPENRSEYTLFYVDLKPGEQGEQPAIVPSAQWHLLLDLDSLRPFQGFSREEQLLRERKRMGSFGITSYEYDKNSRSILFPACSSLYMCRDHVLPSVSIGMLKC